MKTFIKEPVPIPENGDLPRINVKVFDDYDKLDHVAESRGYLPIEMGVDVDFDTQESNYLVGMDNKNLHCGWIATMDDRTHKSMEQVKLLNEKIRACLAKGEQIRVGFARTGHFSVGYTIYVKGIRCATCGTLQLKENMEIIHKHGMPEHGHCANCVITEKLMMPKYSEGD